ncbi:MAG: hypothetical protein H0X30_01755 [Anaerolineae bacterium]|nr:hypothetical protein [Anaerolineae bacterium]
MSRIRLFGAVLMVLLCLTSAAVFAQDATAEPTAEAAPPPVPTDPLMLCPADVTATTVCDIIATKAEDMVGVWAVYFGGKPAFLRFNADGTWVTGNTAESTSAASVEGYPAGTSSIDADGVWTTLDTLLPNCQSGRYLVRVIMVGGQPVALNLALVEDCFAPRQSDYGYTLLRVGE